jgi:hypothetical protein
MYIISAKFNYLIFFHVKFTWEVKAVLHKPINASMLTYLVSVNSSRNLIAGTPALTILGCLWVWVLSWAPSFSSLHSRLPATSSPLKRSAKLRKLSLLSPCSTVLSSEQWNSPKSYSITLRLGTSSRCSGSHSNELSAQLSHHMQQFLLLNTRREIPKLLKRVFL